jgi:hypothetical protein
VAFAARAELARWAADRRQPIDPGARHRAASVLIRTCEEILAHPLVAATARPAPRRTGARLGEHRHGARHGHAREQQEDATPPDPLGGGARRVVQPVDDHDEAEHGEQPVTTARVMRRQPRPPNALTAQKR